MNNFPAAIIGLSLIPNALFPTHLIHSFIQFVLLADNLGQRAFTYLLPWQWSDQGPIKRQGEVKWFFKDMLKEWTPDLLLPLMNNIWWMFNKSWRPQSRKVMHSSWFFNRLILVWSKGILFQTWPSKLRRIYIHPSRQAFWPPSPQIKKIPCWCWLYAFL